MHAARREVSRSTHPPAPSLQEGEKTHSRRFTQREVEIFLPSLQGGAGGGFFRAIGHRSNTFSPSPTFSLRSLKLYASSRSPTLAPAFGWSYASNRTGSFVSLSTYTSIRWA